MQRFLRAAELSHGGQARICSVSRQRPMIGFNPHAAHNDICFSFIIWILLIFTNLAKVTERRGFVKSVPLRTVISVLHPHA